MDLSHRLIHWVAQNQKRIIFVLCAGIAFFGLLAAVTLWQQKRESKAQGALFLAGQEKQKLEQMAQDFPRSRAALIAMADLAAASLGAKDFEACFKGYEQLYEKSGRRAYFRILALHGMGTCLRGKGDYKTAATYFERASKDPENAGPLYSQFEAVKTLAMAKDPAAKAGFEALLKSKDLPPDLKEKIEEQLSWLSPQKDS